MPLMPSVIGAKMMLVNDSATESCEPATGSIKAETGACPIEVAIPFSPL